MCSLVLDGSTLHVHSSVSADHVQEHISDEGCCESLMPHIKEQGKDVRAIGVIEGAPHPRCNALDSSSLLRPDVLLPQIWSALLQLYTTAAARQNIFVQVGGTTYLLHTALCHVSLTPLSTQRLTPSEMPCQPSDHK